MKLYDFDGMFDQKLGEFIKKNGSKYTESEWENVIPQMYAKFGDTVIKSLGKTPNQYFAEMSDEQLIACLKAHLKQGVGVSEFLCNAIEGRSAVELLLPLLDGSDDERSYALNIIGADKRAVPAYLKLLTTSQDKDVADTCAEYLKQFADDIKEQALEFYKQGVQSEYMLEILSRCVVRDARVTDLLIKAFREGDDIEVRAGYLAAYGDESALPCLLEAIEREDINFVEFRELRYAIESLGGSYDKPRDFSSDPYFELIKSHDSSGADLFESFNQDKK